MMETNYEAENATRVKVVCDGMVDIILRSAGMTLLLTSLITNVRSQLIEENLEVSKIAGLGKLTKCVYLAKLLDDLETTLENYKNRYEGEEE